MTTPASSHRFIRPGQVTPDLPAPDACMKCGQPFADHPAAAAGPFGTERQAREAARQVYDAFDTNPGPGKMAPVNLAMLTDAVNVAGVQLGDYDRRILEWLAGWEPQTCAVIAGLITRAAGR